MRRGRYEATEAIGAWTAAYDESGHMFWYVGRPRRKRHARNHRFVSPVIPRERRGIERVLRVRYNAQDHTPHPLG